MTKDLIVNNINIKELVSEILNIYPNIRESSEYENLNFMYMEYTMSCNFQEQREWMKYYIQQGLNKIDLNNLSNKSYYKDIVNIIVAYDLMVEEV